MLYVLEKWMDGSHRWMDRNGKWLLAQRRRTDDALMCAYPVRNRRNNKKNHMKRSNSPGRRYNLGVNNFY